MLLTKREARRFLEVDKKTFKKLQRDHAITPIGTIKKHYRSRDLAKALTSQLNK